MQQPGWTPFSNAVLRLPCTHEPVGVVCIECQCMAMARAFLEGIVFYIGQLERYSHQGYELYGKRTKEDVEATRVDLIRRWFQLSPEARELLDTQQVDIASLRHPAQFSGFDTGLVYFHAAHLHLDPVAMVSYGEDVQPYHQEHLARVIQDGPGRYRNFATLYFSIHVEDKSSRPRTCDLSGSYAGRSGGHPKQGSLLAPSEPGFGTHTVPSTSSDEPARFQFFCDLHDRGQDSEVAIVEDLTLKIETAVRQHHINHPEYSGYVTLFTDRATCNSCVALIMQFQHRFGIQVRVIHGGVDDAKGYCM